MPTTTGRCLWIVLPGGPQYQLVDMHIWRLTDYKADGSRNVIRGQHFPELRYGFREIFEGIARDFLKFAFHNAWLDRRNTHAPATHFAPQRFRNGGNGPFSGTIKSAER